MCNRQEISDISKNGLRCNLSSDRRIVRPYLFIFITLKNGNIHVSGPICFSGIWNNGHIYVEKRADSRATIALSLLIKPLSGHWPLAGIALLVAEGLSYTIGTVVYATNKPNLWPGKFSAHDLWHIFVLLGSALHFAAVYKYVAMI
jgi:hypothetical protein